MKELLYYEITGIEVYRVAISFFVILAAFIVRKLFDKIISRKLLAWANRTKFRYDNMVVEAIIPPVNALILVYGLFLAVTALNIPITEFIINALRITLAVVVVWIIYRLCSPGAEVLRDLMAKSEESLAIQFAPILRKAMRITIVLVGGIMIVQNLGYSVGSLLAGLGVGGLAIALAAQETVSNLFGTLVMFTDKPFKVGDWIQFKEVDGDVESIGLRSTRVRTWAKSLKIIPNKMLTSEIIENWSVMPKRRVRMTIGLTYDSPPEKIEELVERIYDILKSDNDINQEYMIVSFSDFGASHLEIFIYYFTVSIAWADYMHARQRVNLEIMKLVQKLGLSFAFPSQTVYFGDTLRLRSGNGSLPSDDAGLPQ
jgi:MscS family membrane protein